MSKFTKEDEELIKKFIGLSTRENQGTIITLPEHATTSVSWNLCTLVKIISDRTAIESSFRSAMLKAWGADPAMGFHPIERNCFLLEFTNEADLNTALYGGPWSYRGDMVAMKQVSSTSVLKAEEVNFAEIWVQIFNVPVQAFSDEGFKIMVSDIGSPVSAPMEGFVMGKRFVKIRVKIDTREALTDYIKVTHPTLGELCFPCCYEKISRACCFCGALGHEISGCKAHNRLSQLAHVVDQEGLISSAQLLAPKFGAWRVDSALLPRADAAQNSKHTQPKRAFAQTNMGRNGNNSTRGPVTQHSSSSSPLTIFDFELPSHPIKRPRPAGLSTPGVDQ